MNGSTVFNRSWVDYKVGFNDSRGNYWIGNDLLHQLTTSGRYNKLRFDLQERVNLSWYYAEYSTFTILSEASNYTLRVSGYSGNAGNALRYNNGMLFSTFDRDNDPWTGGARQNNNCAVLNGGGFWYKGCGLCNVNTLRGRGQDFAWYQTGNNLWLQTSRMWLTC